MRRGEEWWDRYYLGLAEYVSSASKDPSTKVGAVIVKDNRVVATGYNGFPETVEDTEERLNNRETKYKFVVHAELNAILTAGHRCEGATIYIVPSFGTPNVCSSCCKAVIQSGIYTIVGWEPDAPTEVQERWRDEIECSRIMCEEAGIEVVQYKKEIR